MADVFSKTKRSQVMAAIRGKGNKDTELKLVGILRTHDITGWRRHQQLPGCPDFIFRRERIALFVDGCFWHNCPKHGRKPGTNRAYWIPKLRRNQKRDAAVKRSLTKSGWVVIRLWEHELAAPNQVAKKLIRALTLLRKMPT